MKAWTAGLVLGATILTGAAKCGDPQPAQSPNVFEVGDCDEDDSVAKGDMECLVPPTRPRPMKTAYQPKPTNTRRK